MHGADACARLLDSAQTWASAAVWEAPIIWIFGGPNRITNLPAGDFMLHFGIETKFSLIISDPI